MTVRKVVVEEIYVEHSSTSPASRVLVGAALDATVARASSACSRVDCPLEAEGFYRFDAVAATAHIASVSCRACTSPETVHNAALELNEIAESVVTSTEQSA